MVFQTFALFPWLTVLENVLVGLDAAHIRLVLSERPGHSAPRQRFSPELEDHQTAADAERTLAAVIDWGRFAEIFAYDQRRRLLRLPPETK